MIFKKILSVILATATVLACIVMPSIAVVTSSDFTADELDCSTYDIRKYTDPFWEGNIVYNEIVHPIFDEDGTLPLFPLMYEASEIVSVKDYTLKVTYTEGKDYTLIDGKLCINPTGSIYIMDYEDMHPSSVPAGYGADEFMPYYPHADKTTGRWEYWTGGSDICKYSLAVTYIHNDTWDAPIQTSQEHNLPKTFNKLKNDEPVTIVVAGDSVASGAMASGFIGVSPYADAYPEMAVNALKEKYSNDGITLINSAIGGTMSYFEVNKMNSTIISHSPDLVIINFGMNDSSCGRVGIPKEEFKANIALQIEYIQEKLPDCEVLLLSSLYGNRYTFPAERYEEHAAALHELAAEYDGVGVADPQRIEKYLIEETGKDYICFTADNMVHPGDLGMRLSAQAVIEALSMSDIEEYRDTLIAQMTEYCDLANQNEIKYGELTAIINEVSSEIAALDEEWDINSVIDGAYPAIDKILSRCDVHTFVDTIVAPTCKDNGYTLSVCSNCDYEYTHSSTDLIGGEHIMDSGRLVTSPTYKKDGELLYSCARCEYTETESVPMLTNPPTLSDKGMLHFGNDHNYMASNITPYIRGSGFVELDFCPINIERYDGIPYIGLWFHNYTITACYNFRAQQVQIIETALPFSSGTVYASADYEWTSNDGDFEYNWKRFAVKLVGNTVQIYIDGELILEDTKSFYSSSSEVALLYSNGECYIDNIKVGRGAYDPTTGSGGTAVTTYNFDTRTSYNSFCSNWDQAYGNMQLVTANAANVTTGHYEGHTHSGSIYNIIEPGCGVQGYYEYLCDMCGEIYCSNFIDPTHDDHTLINKTMTVRPTSVSNGEYEYGCETCSMFFIEIIPKGTKVEADDDNIVKGDVNNDGSVDTIDISLLQRFIKINTISINFAGADVNGDGAVDNIDLSLLKSMIRYKN